ncbi:MAG: response regulator [Chthoniobacterales bacterium]
MKPAERSLLRILHLEDSDLDAELLTRELRSGGLEFITRRVQTQTEFEKGLAEFEPTLILADYKLPTFDGMRAIEIVKERSPNIPVIIVSGTVGEETAIQLLRNGATDIVLKEHLRDRLVKAIKRAMEEAWNKKARRQLEEEREQLVSELRHLASHDPLTGASSRSGFMEFLGQATGKNDPNVPHAALFHININHFREMNTHYGSAVVT